MSHLPCPQLPPGFLFGTSTASYQIEGGVAEGGRGPSIWDTFCVGPGRIVDGSSGDVACDHFHRYAEDVALMERLGAGGYRFSIAWPRIQPDGTGAPNAAGLDFYDRLVDALLAAGITPMATLFHWDLPQALEDKGGWLERATAEAFAEFAELVGTRFADRVAHWVPVNEPNVVTMLGYALGIHAPGRTLLFDALPAAHHLLLGHGLATQALRSAGATSVGTATNHTPVWPASDDPADVEAAGLYDTLWNALFADPVLLGRYPEGFADLMPGPVAEDLALIGAPLEFYGVNYYNPTRIRAPRDPAQSPATPAPGWSSPVETPAPGWSSPVETPVQLPPGLPFEFAPVHDRPMTDFGWPVVPEGLRELLVSLRERYPGLPTVFITESGCSYGIGPDADGVVDDRPRIDYLDSHLRAVADAIADGVDVRGYFTWSLMDNFEWAEGYTQRFGLVHVDYDTLVRTPKRSFDWYAETIRSQRRTEVSPPA